MRRSSLLLVLAFLGGCGSDPAETTPEDGAVDSVVVVEAGDTDAEDSALADSTVPDADSATADADAAPVDAAVDSSLDVGEADVAGDSTPSCPAPTGGVLQVGPTGNDATGNGSTMCPLKTITAAVAHAESASTAITIQLQAGTAGAPVVYGAGCTGGAPCDVLPIVVPATVTKGLVIRSTGVAAATRIVGGTTAD